MKIWKYIPSYRFTDSTKPFEKQFSIMKQKDKRVIEKLNRSKS